MLSTLMITLNKKLKKRKVTFMKNHFIKCTCSYYNQNKMVCPYSRNYAISEAFGYDEWTVVILLEYIIVINDGGSNTDYQWMIRLLIIIIGDNRVHSVLTIYLVLVIKNALLFDRNVLSAIHLLKQWSVVVHTCICLRIVPD